MIYFKRNMMNPALLQSIIVQIIVLIAQLYIATNENIKHIFVARFIYNALYMVLYFINGDITTTLTYVLNTVRSAVYIERQEIYRHKWHFIVPISFISVQIILGLLTMNNYWQLLSIFCGCYFSYYLWFYKTTQKLRIGNMVGDFLWLIYNVISRLWIVAAGRVIVIFMNAISYHKHKRVSLD